MASASNFRTALHCHNVIYTCNVFANESIGKMISHGRNAFPCNVMHANQGPVQAFSSKSHVQKARESYDLNMDFAGSNSLRNEFPCKNHGLLLMAEAKRLSGSNLEDQQSIPYKSLSRICSNMHMFIQATRLEFVIKNCVSYSSTGTNNQDKV